MNRLTNVVQLTNSGMMASAWYGYHIQRQDGYCPGQLCAPNKPIKSKIGA